MTVERNRTNITIDVWIEVATSLTMIHTTGNDMPQMRNYTCGNKQLPFSIVVDSPRVTEAVCDDLKYILGRVITPNAAVDLAFALKLDRLGIRLAVLENLVFLGFQPLTE